MNDKPTSRLRIYFLMLLTCLLASVVTYAQDLVIDPSFNNMYGNGGVEEFYNCFETADGGFMLGGKAQEDPPPGNINDPFCGSSDYWLIKTDAAGNTVWDSLYGGLAQESLFDVIQTSDGGFAVIGTTNSPASCDVPAGNPFVVDAWVLKVDNIGNVLWTTRLGSLTSDNAKSIIETADGGLLIGGDTPDASGIPDYWLAKLDGTTGTIQWENTYGGNDFDFLEVVRATSDGFYLGGFSLSPPSNEKTSPHFGSFDYWVVKTDLDGNFLWDVSFGGNGNDQLFDMEVTSDGGMILTGFSDSDPTIAPNNKTAALIGVEDAWSVKMDDTGAMEWDMSYGGDESERFYSVDIVDVTDCTTNYIFGGLTNSSSNGDIANANLGVADYWLVWAGESGNLIWEKNYGGNDYDAAWDFRRNSDSTYIVGGHTISDSPGAPFDTPSSNFGIFDNWVFKLNCDFDLPAMPTVQICEGESIIISAVTGNPANCTYLWENGLITRDIIVNPAVTTNYKVSVTNGTCCMDTTSVTVEVIPLPEVDLGPDTEICPNEIITLDATTTGCTYAWSTGDTDPTIDLDMAGTYAVTITCDFGCTAADTLIVSPGIIPDVNLGSNITLCTGDSTLLDAGNGGIAYNWSTGATTPTIFANSPTNYCVTVTSVDGCTSSDCVQVDFESVTVNLQNDTTLCEGEMITVSAGNTGCSFLWSNAATTQSIDISTAGTYTVTVTCDPTGCTAEDEITVSYFPTINTNFSSEICQGDSALIAGIWETSAGFFLEILTDANGCDSIIITELIVNPTFTENTIAEICEGDSIFLASAWQFTAGDYSDTLQTIQGCDSVIITSLTVHPIFMGNMTAEICEGDSLFVGGAWQLQSGSYADTLQSIDISTAG
ncbi:MAG: hypothetical protein AAF573_15685, partial [Bacteroidota bacterium]